MKRETIRIGQMKNDLGQPVPDSGVELYKDSPTARLLLAQPTIIITNVITKEYGARVHVTDKDGQIVIKGLGIIPPGCIGPPEHIHPTYDETFTVVEGSFEFLMNKKIHIAREGDTIVVPRGTAHTFRPADRERVCSFILEADPPGKLEEVVRTIFGLALEGKTNAKGQPNDFWQTIAIGSELKEDTLFVSPPPAIQKLLFNLFGKTARRKGYQGIYERYSDDEFWIKRVCQLPENSNIG